MLSTRVIRSIEEQEWIDRAAVPVRDAVARALGRVPRIADFLHGKWLGHPLHAALVSVPLGAWSAGLGLDLAEILGGASRYRRAADVVTAIGLGGAVLAVFAGVADWSTTRGAATR